MTEQEQRKQKVRRCARYLQGNDTSYFINRSLLEAVCLLYKLADEIGKGK
jgi:hypothetical protein